LFVELTQSLKKQTLKLELIEISNEINGYVDTKSYYCDLLWFFSDEGVKVKIFKKKTNDQCRIDST